jgi:hypothetical protein
MTESTNPVRELSVARLTRPRGRRTNVLLRSVKFAFAAMLAGSRAVPLGDNSRVTRELAAYGDRLRHDALTSPAS